MGSWGLSNKELNENIKMHDSKYYVILLFYGRVDFKTY